MEFIKGLRWGFQFVFLLGAIIVLFAPGPKATPLIPATLALISIAIGVLPKLEIPEPPK